MRFQADEEYRRYCERHGIESGGGGMSGPDDSGFAFSQSVECWGGVSKREYFSAHAPIALDDARDSLKTSGHSEVTHAQIFRRLAQMRFAYADAMQHRKEQ
jgi:hypothetical protein